MTKVSIDILVPVFNEGDKILELLKLFEKNIKNQFRVLFCYDNDDDDILSFSKYFKNFKYEIKLIKNPSKGPCSAIKEGFKMSNSNCAVSYTHLRAHDT